MLRHKRKGKSEDPSGLPPKLDMNPMVDMAFLLVTFFMLTTTFKTDDLVTVNVPFAHTEMPIPGKDMAVIGVSDEGTVTFSIDGKHARKKVLELMGSTHGVDFSSDELEKFSLSPGVGFPIAQMPEYINTEPAKRKEIPLAGIPSDSTQNELKEWIQYARIANPRVRYAIRGDKEADYPTIQFVMNTLVESGISRFNLITDQEF